MYLQIASEKKYIRIASIMCIATCGLEALCAGRGASFLVETRNISVDKGAKFIIFFYLGIVILLFPNTMCSVIGMFLTGFNAVLAPNILYLAPQDFGVKISQSVTGLEMAAMYAGVLGIPAVFGILTNYLPVSLFPIYAVIIFAVLIYTTLLLRCRLNRTLLDR